jgi:hypothetical protein
MSSARRIIPVTLDAQTTSRRVVSGGALKAPDSTQGLDLYVGTQILFQATIYDGYGTAYQPPAGAWLFGIDSRAFQASAWYVESADAVFNIAADWADLDEANGKICWRADLTGAPLKAAMIAAGDPATMYANLWLKPTSEDYLIVASWPVSMREIYVDPAGV